MKNNYFKNVKKICYCFLLMLMFISIISFAGCQKQTDSDVTDENDTSDTNGTPESIPFVEPDELTLVSEGVSEYVIVRGENASPSEITASTELQKYLKQISGAELAIVTDSTAAVDKEIVVGKTNRENDGEFDRETLGTEGFLIKTRGYKLFLVGGEKRGTLYSVYEFLESYLGCRFFTQTVETIPTQSTVTIAAIKEDLQLPYFDYRNVFWYDYFQDQIAAKRKVNATTGRAFSEEYGGKVEYTGSSAHTFTNFCSADVYFEEHPEYFALNGKIRDRGSLCLTNPDVLQLAIDYTRGLLEQDPNARMISITQNDNVVWCMCDECKAVYEEEGGHYSGTMLRFANAIARDIAKDYPNVFIDTFAYLQTASAPTKTVAEDNVIVRLCHVTGCSSHTVEDRCWGGTIHKYASNLDGRILPLADCLEEWGKICKNVYVWDYNTCFHQYNQIYPNFDPLLDNMAYYQANNVRGIFAQGAYQGESGEFAELRAYLTAKILWNPLMTKEEYYAHMDEFLAAVYGPGGGKLREFINLAEELSNETCFHWGLDMTMFVESPKHTIDINEKALPADLTRDMIENYETVDWSPYYWYYETVTVSCDLLERGRALFAEASEMAETDTQKKAIEQASVQLDLLESYYRDAINTAITKNLQFLIETYINEKTDILGGKSLATKIARYVVNNDLIPAYEQFNRDICEKAISFNIRYAENDNSFATVKKYESNPDRWFQGK